MPTKVCSVCAADVSDKPRVRDAQGRYYCKPCEERLGAGRAARGAPGRPAPTSPTKAPATPPVPAAAASTGASDDEIGLDLSDVVKAEASASASLMACPSCGSSLPSGARLCAQCGYDLATGAKLQTSVGAPIEAPDTVPLSPGGRCGKCSYSLKELMTIPPKPLRCPECGSVNSIPSATRARIASRRDEHKGLYTVPAMMVAGGCVVGITATAIAFERLGIGSAAGAPMGFLVLAATIWYLVEALVHALAAGIIYTALSLVFFGGYSQNTSRWVLNVLATAFVMEAVWFVLIAIHPDFWLVWWFLYLFIYIGVASARLDLSTNEALAFAFVTGIASTAIGMALAIGLEALFTALGVI
jgi:hypothetical protein